MNEAQVSPENSERSQGSTLRPSFMSRKKRQSTSRALELSFRFTREDHKSVESEAALNFDDIRKIEKKRRALLLNVKHANSYSVLFAYSGTLLPSLVTDFQLWVSILLYVVLRILIRTEVLNTEEVPSADLEYVSIIGGFLSFFLVFYADQSYNRFNDQYKSAMSAERDIFDLANLVKTVLPEFERNKLIRLINAAHMLAYIGISDSYNKDNFFKPLNTIYKLLTPEEETYILDLGIDEGATCYHVVLSWITEMLFDCRQDGTIMEIDYELLVTEVWRVSENLADMFEHDDQPIPFVYLHLIFIISLVYLPLFSFTLAVSDVLATGTTAVEFVSIVALVITCVFVLGLRDLGRILQDPYGNDLQDLSVLHYITYTIQMSRRIINSYNPTRDRNGKMKAIVNKAPKQRNKVVLSTTMGNVEIQASSGCGGPASPPRDGILSFVEEIDGAGKGERSESPGLLDAKVAPIAEVEGDWGDSAGSSVDVGYQPVGSDEHLTAMENSVENLTVRESSGTRNAMHLSDKRDSGDSGSGSGGGGAGNMGHKIVPVDRVERYMDHTASTEDTSFDVVDSLKGKR